jgi:hypothetical protein
VRPPRPIEELVDWLRYDLPRKLPSVRGPSRTILLGVLAAIALIAAAWGITSLIQGDDEPEVETKVVTVPVETDDPADAPVGPLGFPLVATRNTTRVGGTDPATDAAAVALATHPPSPTADDVEAAVLVEDGSPYAGIAASVLAGPPLRAPILIGNAGAVPAPSADALAKIDPRGGSGPADAAVYLVGDVAAPSGLQSEEAAEGSPAEIADAVDELRSRLLAAEPEHIVVASSDEPAYAMPAAAWAARSGDPVLFAGRDEVPEATIRALERHRGTPVYVLGPPSVISDEAVRQIERVSPGVERVGAEGPTENAIAFARYTDQTFGWNINDPGHGLVIANADRPLDAAAAASISASGKWGPLLVIENAGTLPPELRTFLLDIKPGFEDDPTRAVYNHIWLIGDTSAIGARVQAEIDDLAELTEVGTGAGGAIGEPDGGAGFAPPGSSDAEPEPIPKPGRGQP